MFRSSTPHPRPRLCSSMLITPFLRPPRPVFSSPRPWSSTECPLVSLPRDSWSSCLPSRPARVEPQWQKRKGGGGGVGRGGRGSAGRRDGRGCSGGDDGGGGGGGGVTPAVQSTVALDFRARQHARRGARLPRDWRATRRRLTLKHLSMAILTSLHCPKNLPYGFSSWHATSCSTNCSEVGRQ